MLTQNLSMVHGDTMAFNVVVTQDGALYNVTGCTFYFTVKVNYTDADNAAVFQLTSAGGAITIVDGPNGLVQVVVPAAQSYTPTWADADTIYNYDIQMKNGSLVYTLARGKLTVLAEVTKT